MASRVAANYRVKMESNTKAYHVKKYSRESEVDVVTTSNKDDAIVSVDGMINQDTDPDLGEVPYLEGYHKRGEKGAETSG